MLLFKPLPEDLLHVDGEGDTPAPDADKPADGGADPTPAPDVKDEKPPVDPDAKPADPADPDAKKDDEPDPQEQTVQQLAEARAAKLLEERLAERDAERAAEDAAAKTAARAEETGRLVTAAKQKASTDIVTALKGFRVLSTDGKSALDLTEEQMNTQVFKPMNEMLVAIESSYEAQAADEFVGAALDLVPDEGREAFIKATADANLSAADWLMAAAEALAPKTKWARTAALSHADAVATAKAEGFDAGKAAKAVAQPGMQDGNKRTPLTTAAFLAMSIEDQAKAMRERPAEVDALK